VNTHVVAPFEFSYASDARGSTPVIRVGPRLKFTQIATKNYAPFSA
jgi:hypothetical protein